MWKFAFFFVLAGVLAGGICNPPGPPPCETDSDCIPYCSPDVAVCMTGSCVCFSPNDPFLDRLDDCAEPAEEELAED